MLHDPLVGHPDAGARVDIRLPNGGVVGKTKILGGGGNEGPNAFLVEQGPDVVLPPNFHRNRQFQLVVGGSGVIGSAHKLDPLTIHYAEGETGDHRGTCRARLHHSPSGSRVRGVLSS